MNVFLSTCGEGFGHSSRMAALYFELGKRGINCVIGSYGRPLERLKLLGIPALELMPEARMSGSRGKLSLFKSFMATTSQNHFAVLKREFQVVEENQIDFIVSDMRIAPLVVAKQLKIPVLLVTNQAKMVNERLKKRLSLEALQIEVLNKVVNVPIKAMCQAADYIVVPDFLPPNTICLDMILKSEKYLKKTRFVGPMSLSLAFNAEPFDWPSQSAGSLKGFVTAGGQVLRKEKFDELVSSLESIGGCEFLVSSIFVESDSGSKNVFLRKYSPNVMPFEKAADFLIMPAGHSGIMEAIVFEKPMILIPDAAQPEQISNAKMVEKFGLGLELESQNVHLIGEKIKALRERLGFFKANLKKFHGLALGNEDGARNAADFIVKVFEERQKKLEKPGGYFKRLKRKIAARLKKLEETFSKPLN